jgi:hypothetical protein
VDLDHRISLRSASITSMGLVRNLAEDAGKALAGSRAVAP